VEDVVGLYLEPPDKALVLCIDEKSQIQALVAKRMRVSLCQRVGRDLDAVRADIGQKNSGREQDCATLSTDRLGECATGDTHI
jgi:hypothetical protein